VDERGIEKEGGRYRKTIVVTLGSQPTWSPTRIVNDFSWFGAAAAAAAAFVVRLDSSKIVPYSTRLLAQSVSHYVSQSVREKRNSSGSTPLLSSSSPKEEDRR
jgi:hypothetical protein